MLPIASQNTICSGQAFPAWGSGLWPGGRSCTFRLRTLSLSRPSWDRTIYLLGPLIGAPNEYYRTTRVRMRGGSFPYRSHRGLKTMYRARKTLETTRLVDRITHSIGRSTELRERPNYIGSKESIISKYILAVALSQQEDIGPKRALGFLSRSVRPDIEGEGPWIGYGNRFLIETE